MPADHGVGFHQDQDVRPAGPPLAKCRPEESVPGAQFWPRPFPFQHGELLRRARTSRAVSPRLRKKTRLARKKERMIRGHEHSFNTPQAGFAGTDAAKTASR